MNTRIKQLRHHFGLTQQEFADRLGIKRGAIANYEVARNEPVDSVISLICREFHVNETWLRTGAGEMLLPESNNIINQLASEYHLSRGATLAVEKFIKLKPAVQEEILNYFTEVALALHAPIAPDSMTKPLTTSNME